MSEQELGKLEAERDFLRRELRGTQEMLVQVLYEAGGEVVVPKSNLQNNVVEGMQIIIDTESIPEAFIFKLVKTNDVV